jgi:ferredoxin
MLPTGLRHGSCSRGGRENSLSIPWIKTKETGSMTYVVCEPCHDCKFTDCVVVCPCECFYQDEHMLYIDPADCIDCNACVPECPVEAIFHESAVPTPWAHFVSLNAERVEVLKTAGGHITERQEPKRGPGCRR